MKPKLGFSLIELLIVLTLVAAITTLAVNVYSSSGEKATLVAVESDLAKLANQLERYRQRHGTYEVDKDSFETAQLELLINHSPSYLPFAKRKFELIVASASKHTYQLKALPVNNSNASVTLFSNGNLLLESGDK